MKLNNKEMDEKNISQYHHPINTSYNITAHTSIYNIFTDIITNPRFKINERSKSIKELCGAIKEIQIHLNDYSDVSDEYKYLKNAKTEFKSELGGCYYQILKPEKKAGEDGNVYTGYLVVDLDHYSEDYTKLKQQLRNIPEVVLFFESPSGGLKIILSTDLRGTINRNVYKECYQSVIEYLNTSYGIDVDYDETAQLNHNLICFYAYDPDAYFNDNVKSYECYDKAIEATTTDLLGNSNKINANFGGNNDKNYPAIENMDELILKAIEGYEIEHPNDNYSTWRDFNFALCDALEDEYISIAIGHYGESERKHIEAFYKASNSSRTNKISIGSLVRYAKLAGFSSDGEQHEYSNVIGLELYQRAKLKKNNLVRKDLLKPAPSEIYPNCYEKLVRNSDGEYVNVATPYKDNENLFSLMIYLGIELGYDEIKGIKIGQIPFNSIAKNCPNYEEVLQNDLEDIVMKNDFPKDKVNHLLKLHHANTINPLVDMCKANEWDGVDRVIQILDCVQVKTGYEQWFSIALTRWLIQCVAAWNHAELSGNMYARPVFDNVLIFSGSQGINKSSFMLELLPDELSDYAKDGVQLDPDNKDSVRQAVSYGLVELGEIDATFKVKDISKLKSFLSSVIDRFREAYAKKDTIKFRRTSFFGTVNGTSFLRDLTGNRRYYPIAVVDIDFDVYKGIDKHQLWAQVWKLYIEGAQWWIDKNTRESQLQNEILSRHAQDVPIFDNLNDVFDLTKKEVDGVGQYYTTAQILEKIDVFNDVKNVRMVNSYLEAQGVEFKNPKNKKNWWLVKHSEVASTKRNFLGMTNAQQNLVA